MYCQFQKRANKQTNHFTLVVLPDHFRGMGVRRNSAETQQSGHAPRSGPEIEAGRSSAKDDAPDVQIRDNTEGGELDPAADVRRHCKRNSSSVLSCIDKRTKEGCDRSSEVGAVPGGLH